MQYMEMGCVLVHLRSYLRIACSPCYIGNTWDLDPSNDVDYVGLLPRTRRVVAVVHQFVDYVHFPTPTNISCEMYDRTVCIVPNLDLRALLNK